MRTTGCEISFVGTLGGEWRDWAALAGDVASDVLHLGDAITGIGGTAASLGAQAGLIACQIAVEMERAEDRMVELQQEINALRALPPENRLREYYELDDEAIAQLRTALESPEPSESP